MGHWQRSPVGQSNDERLEWLSMQRLANAGDVHKFSQKWRFESVRKVCGA